MMIIIYSSFFLFFLSSIDSFLSNAGGPLAGTIYPPCFTSITWKI